MKLANKGCRSVGKKLVDGDHQNIANAENEIAELRERIARTQPIVDKLTEAMKDVQSNMARGNRAFVEAAGQERHAVNMVLGQVLAMRVHGKQVTEKQAAERSRRKIEEAKRKV